MLFGLYYRKNEITVMKEVGKAFFKKILSITGVKSSISVSRFRLVLFLFAH